MSACSDCLERGLLLRELAARIDRCVDRRAGSRARDLLALDDISLLAATGATMRARSVPRPSNSSAVADLRAELERLGCWAACRHDQGWPPGLDRLGAAAPRALFCRGDRDLLGSLGTPAAITIVGARRAGPYGLEVAASITGRLAAAGLPVISGLAFGIDAAAHRGALDAAGATVAVLGAGPERPYPRSSARLYREICGSGLVISELPPGSPTFRWMFPARNRLMAALGDMTVVVEAAERSGSLITAEMAADCGRSVGAVPGPVTSWRSQGTNALLADGACMVRGAEDVVEHLLGPGTASAPPPGPALTPQQATVLGHIDEGLIATDAVVAASGLGAGDVAAALSGLELGGYLQIGVDGGLRRTPLRPPPAREGEANTMGE